MARSKRKSKAAGSKDQREEVYDEPDPDRDDFFHDDVDKFHAEREKILLDSTAYDKDGQELSSDENEQDEEVMALNIDESDDDDDDDDDGGTNEDDVEEQEDEELDEEEEESDDGKDVEKDIPSQKSWGRKKAAFYDADIVEEYTGSDEEMDQLAEEEEEEALVLQKHMAASLEEQDYDTAEFELPKPDHKTDKDDEQNKERIVQDLSKLSEAEKIQILMKDSPELFQLINEFKSKLKEVIEKLHPLVKMARTGQIPKEGVNYLELKHQLFLNYCINVGFYLLLKAKKLSVRNHPVLERLVQYQKLITELKPMDEKLKPEVEELLSQIRVSEQNGLQEKLNVDSVKMTSKKPSKKPAKLSTLLDEDDNDEECAAVVKNCGKEKEGKLTERKKEKKRKRKEEKESDMMDPLEYYEAVKLQKKRKKEAKKVAYGFTEQQVADEEDIEEGKRGITYAISQNKGLTAKKKKELRNPRVKHRKKFYKAKIKRKSQVLPVVNEQNRYGGEMTGIRSHLTRSIKIK